MIVGKVTGISKIIWLGLRNFVLRNFVFEMGKFVECVILWHTYKELVWQEMYCKLF